MKVWLSFLALVFVTACAVPRTKAYQSFYAHLDKPCFSAPIELSDYFLIIYIDAPHLDYTENHSLLKTIAKHPSNGSKNRDVGHSWIYLQGIKEGSPICVEGGHSGERGILQAKYFDGIMNYIDFGYANPTQEQALTPRFESNPIKYLWETQHDGFFQRGCGGHKATSAFYINLTLEQFELILQFIQNYPYEEYALTGNQCTTFVAQIASLAGLEVECTITIPINQHIYVNGSNLTLWRDPVYSQLTIATPDILEKSLLNCKSRAIHCDSHRMKTIVDINCRARNSRS